MADAPFVTDEARAVIGEETTFTYEVSKEDIKKMVIAAEDLNLLYLDEEIARKSRYGGIIAHPLQCLVVMQPPRPLSELGEFGTRQDRDPPMKFSKKAHGGSDIEFFTPVRPGDTLTAKRKIADITERQSSKGAWIAIVPRDMTITNQKGELVAKVRESTVYS